MPFLGFATLAAAIRHTVLTRDADGIPENATSLPIFRVYGHSGLMASGTGSASFKDTGSVTAATNASPIVITSSNHGLNTGTRITVTGVLGNTAANGTFNVTVVNSNSFSLDGSTGNGAYTSGGTWNVSGLYSVEVTPTTGNGYEAGKVYTVLITSVVDAVTKAETATFGVI
jgi:hypothetical protein